MHLILSKIPNFGLLKRKRIEDDRLARSLLIKASKMTLSLIDSNSILLKIMGCSERPSVVLMINDLKKCGYNKDNYELNYKFMNNLQPEWKQYDTLMGQTHNLMDITIDALYNILKQNQVNKRKEKVAVQSESEGSMIEDISDLKKLPRCTRSQEKKEDKKVDEKKRDMSKVKCYNCKKEGHFAKDCKKARYTPMFLTHSNEALEIEKFKRARENKIEFAYDYGNLNASSELSENAISDSENQSENDCHEVEKGCDNLENSNVIAPGMFKINVSQSVSPISTYKPSCASNNVENKTKRKRHLDTLFKIDKDVSHIPRKDFVIVYLLMIVNEMFVFDDVNVRKSQVSKMPFKEKHRDSLNGHSMNCPDLSLDMKGNRALLTNFVEKFIGTVRFGNNDFAVIAGYGDVVIGTMTIKKVYYVDGLRHNLFSVGQVIFVTRALNLPFESSTCFVENEDGVDLLTGDRLSNLYTTTLNEIASNSLACLLAKASSSQSWLWHQRLSHLNFATINNLMLSSLKDYDDVGKLKAKGDIGVFVGYSKESAAFRVSHGPLVFQMDVKTVFLNGILKDEVYVCQPLGFVSKKYPNHVYARDKTLYGNKHLGHGLWYPKDSGFDLNRLCRRKTMAGFTLIQKIHLQLFNFMDKSVSRPRSRIACLFLQQNLNMFAVSAVVLSFVMLLMLTTMASSSTK
ncbi:integrase, catalytic region, zinc finger, CCHC-type containing protein [Tanacetum coccineum]